MPTTDVTFEIGDVVQIDPTVSTWVYFATVVGFDGDTLVLSEPRAHPVHYVHRRWCRRIGKAVWLPYSLAGRTGGG